MFRMKYTKVVILLLVFFLHTGYSWWNSPPNDTPLLPATPYNYVNPPLPPHFGTIISIRDNTPEDNPITDEGATLGRVLFYDVHLSANNTTSCGSCHIQSNAFTSPTSFNTGFDGQLTSRNSPQLSNSRYYLSGHFFLDERANTLEEQVLEPIQNPIEMGENLATLPDKLATLDYYPSLFTDAFGDANITTERISKALAQFIRSMVSYQSRFDQGFPNFDNFTPDELAGRTLFDRDCDNCHKTTIQIADDPFNVGLTDGTGTNEDLGIGAITGNPADNGKFKTPSLRNTEASGPFMHDGSLATLADVIEHYNSGIQNHPNLPNDLKQNGQPQNLELGDTEKLQLEAFLKTLTDNAFLTDIKFSDPFTTPLAQDFIDLQARKNNDFGVSLEWTTAGTNPIKYFEIQHSTTNANFSTISTVESQSTTQLCQQYQYLDKMPVFGNNFYRIKQVKIDGSFSFSMVKNVWINSDENAWLQVYPTLVKDKLWMKSHLTIKEPIIISVVNSKGQVMAQFEEEQIEKEQIFEISTQNWAKGIYFISVEQNRRVWQFKVVKTK